VGSGSRQAGTKPKGEPVKLTTIDTPDGPFTILADARVVLASGWTDSAEAILARLRPADRPDSVDLVAPDDPDLAFAVEAVRAYYSGDIEAVNRVPVRQSGSALQELGWRGLREIPPGAPLPYAGFAAVLGRPSAARAAGRICATNAPALFVPCHRVLRGDGTLGGFAWGTPVKASLLAREAAAAGRR
jgi:methylated-DNA-[protein]-cysteine S-methyltransferase